MQQSCQAIQMTHDNHHHNAVSIIATLRECAKQKDLQRGIILHRSIVRNGMLKQNIFVGNTLITMYAKCGALDKAREVFIELPYCNGVSWNALISGYALRRHGQVALDFFQRMLLEGSLPNSVTYACILKACSSIGDCKNGQILHARLFKERLLEKHIVVGNALIDMYAKCGALEKAQEAFNGLRFQSVISWTALIVGYAQHKQHKEALLCFEQMQLSGFSPDAVSFACILKACGNLGALKKGQDIHAQAVREHLLGGEIVIANALLDMYIKCGALEKAQEVFDQLSVWNVVSWTTLIAGYAEHGLNKKALVCFEEMQRFGFCPDAVTFACILKACGNINALNKGQKLHAQIVRNHLMEGHIEVANAVVGMYAKCGAFETAREVFNELRIQDAVSWNALIAGYLQHGHDDIALSCFGQMQLRGFSPSKVTFACILKACGNLGALEKGQEIHVQIARQCLLRNHTVIANALVGMYASCGALEKAQEVFDELQVREIVAWTALISGYVEHEHGEEAISSFEKMRFEGIFPDTLTFASILKACGSVGAMVNGQKIHNDIVKNGLLERDSHLRIALIVMYANCGMLVEAQQLFDECEARDVVVWSVLMVGYAKQGKDETVFCLFERMIEEGVVPDLVTFTIVLSTCSRRGLMDEGQAYFKILRGNYGLVPSAEHHTCMVDLFSRAGYIHKAAAVIEEVPFPRSVAMWQSLLSACQKWLDSKIGKWAFERAVYQNESERSLQV